MNSLNSLKREVEILHRALSINDKSNNSDIIQKLSFYSDKLIEFSRGLDDKALIALNLEIAAFNEAHPLTADDIIKLQPYLDVIEEAATI